MATNCRVCLCGDRRMHSINHTVFQEIWERLTKAKFNINDGKPFFVCYICYAQLRNAHQLMKRALKSEELLTTIKNIGSEQEQRRILLIASLGEDFAYKYTITEAIQHEFNEIQINCLVEIKRENEEGGEEPIEEEEHEVAIKVEEEEASQLECNEIQRNSVEEIKRENEEGGEENIEEENDIPIKEEEEEGAHVRNRTLKEVLGNIKRIKLNQITKDGNSTSDTSCSNQLTVDFKVIPKSERINSEVCHTNAGNKICLAKNARTVPPSTSLERREEGNRLNTSVHKASENVLSCHACPYTCVRKSELKRHLLRHTGEKPFKCDLCGYRGSEKGNLKKHIKSIHTNERNFSCHICQYKSVTKSNLNSHLRKHTGEKPFKCHLCEYRGSEKGNLNKHIKSIHTNERNFSCHICLYKCVDKANLNMHLRKHTGEKPYKCDLCDYKSSRKSTLNAHTKYIHTNKRNFSCHICLHKFVTNSDLNIHLRKHTGERPFKCDLCDYKSSQKGTLINHMKSKHTSDRNFSCHTCLYKCTTEDDLNSHLRQHHGENV